MSTSYNLKMLRINLTDNTIKTEALDEKLAQKFLGGRGLGTKILYDEGIAKVEPLSPENKIIFINGITGPGSYKLSRIIKNGKTVDTLIDNHLRFTMPSALCSYCVGQTKIGEEYEMGSVRKMKFEV